VKKIAIVYESITGNTKEIMFNIAENVNDAYFVDIFKYEAFDFRKINEYDAVIFGTYTWGNGDLPVRVSRFMVAFTEYFEQNPNHTIDTIIGVFGSGDTTYDEFCGAVDKMTSIFSCFGKVECKLKIELNPNGNDHERIKKFIKRLGLE